MPSADDRLPSTSSASASGRRLLSRITSPFASKSRSFAEFTVRVDDPHRQYSPGDLVPGKVELRVVKPTRITHLVVSLHGHAQVYKNPNSPGPDGYRTNNASIGTGKGNRVGEYYGNGFATLFEDEIVLCGDGRLSEGKYQFSFNLEFPDRDLPSSISFERGTISYLITATITRPVTIAPILQCSAEVYFVERIDISQILPPKARTITLEPLSRRSRAKTQARKLVDHSDRKGRSLDSPEPSTDRGRSEGSSARSVLGDLEPPQSPSPSEVSLESGSHTTTQSEALRGNSSRVTLAPPKTITASVESLVGGCLRGDSVPIRVLVSHTKFIKSIYGVIITFYRQARVDLHPSIPLGPTEKGKEGKFENIYPKSLTGLGGLSLSGAGSSHVFRKDLSQVMLPLVVDPATLSAEVNGKVHVPEEAFPTISTVPGAMISFRYYVEVIIDIQGKLSTSERTMANLGGLQGMSTNHLGGERTAFNPNSSPIIDTATLRRDKGVVFATFEIIVGTKDSERRKGKRKAEPEQQQQQEQQQRQQQQGNEPQPAPTSPSAPQHTGLGPVRDFDPQGEEYGHDGSHYGAHTPYHDQTAWHDFQSGAYGYESMDTRAPTYDYPPPMPIPNMEDESQLTEKERMRRAEARLLPGEAPGLEHAEDQYTPTAPFVPEEHSLDDGLHSAAGPSAPMIPSSSTITPYDVYEEAQSPPAVHGDTTRYADASPIAQSASQQRQLGESASYPFPTEGSVQTPHEESADHQQPTAPGADIIPYDDDHIYNAADDSHADASVANGLPRYER